MSGLADAERDARVFVNKSKDYFGRPRPVETDSRVKPVVETGRERCYPSGHATRGAMWAAILCEIAPDEKQALVSRGQEIGWDRVVAGVHYPSDVYAGQVLGKALARAMLSSPKFRERVESAKKEYEARAKGARRSAANRGERSGLLHAAGLATRTARSAI